MLELSLTDAVTPFLTDLENKLSDMQPVLEEIGALMVDSVHNTIDSLGHGSWDPAKVHQDHPLLKDTGDLYNSISYHVADGEVTVDSDCEYAVYQDARRPFMVIQPEDEGKIENLIAEFMNEEREHRRPCGGG